MHRYAFFAVLSLALLTSSISLAEPPPSNGYIGVFGDAAGTQCCFQLPVVQNGNQKMYVFYVTGGAAAAGISGAEFKVRFEPPFAGNVLNWAPAQGIHNVSGDPIDNGSGGGGTMSTNQNQCFTDTGLAGDRILLGEIHVKDMYTAHQLLIEPSDSPANPNFACPAVFLCDGPAFTEVALTLKEGDSALGGQDPVGFISSANSSSCSGSSCGFVATEPTTWSTVKGLFR
jgi:hypothetical protein